MSFLSFDGIDGTGKSTQLGLFAQWLRERGKDVVECRDPGSTGLGEALRRILLGNEVAKIHMRSEMLLYMAARAQLVEEVIRPALKAGKVVVSDRFVLANVVYQAYAGGLDIEETWKVGRIATDNVEPDMTFLLDMEVAAATARLGDDADRLEQRSQDYFEQVRAGFLSEARLRPDRIRVINANGSIQVVQQAIRNAATATIVDL